MVNKRSGYGKSSLYALLAEHLRLEIGGVRELYNFGIAYYGKEMKKLQARWRRLSTRQGQSEDLIEYSVGERDRLDAIRHELGYAMAVLLCSIAEDGVKSILSQLKKSDLALAKKYDRNYKSQKRISFLEKYMRFHKQAFETTLKSVDSQLLADFVWARDNIIHQRGIVIASEVKGRRVPSAPFTQRKLMLVMERKYLEKVIKHLLVFFDKVLADLQARYK